MTVCNMSIEAGARAGMVAPDETTFDYLAGRPYAPQGAEWDAAVARWRGLPTDEGAAFDQECRWTPPSLEPMITFGTNPGTAIAIGSAACREPRRRGLSRGALRYMGAGPRRAARWAGASTWSSSGAAPTAASPTCGRPRSVFEGRHVRRRRARAGRPRLAAGEERGGGGGPATDIFRDAGAEWREPGCSMCIAMNGDRLEPGHYAVSTSNRNFEGRQGAGGRTFLASPLTAAAAAVTGAHHRRPGADRC